MNIVSNHNRLLRGAAIPTAGGDVYNSGWEYTPEGEISGYSGSAIYTGPDCTCDSAAIVDSAFDKSTAWVEEQNYLTAHQDVSNLPYVKNSSLEFNGALISGISGSGFYAVSANYADLANSASESERAISATVSQEAVHAGSADYSNSASSALNAEVANVSYTALTANFLDGGWEHDESGNITAYNNSAFAGSNGGKYEGISPIVVNNEEMKISAESARLGVQDPLYFVEDSNTATVIGIHDSAFPTFEGTEDGKISAINGSAINAASVTEYSAGNNIDITDYVISVTGSVPSADRTDYAVSATSAQFSHSAINSDSANYATKSNRTYSADSATYDSLGRKIVDTYLTAHQELPDWTPTIQNASGNAYNSAVLWVVDQNYLTGVTEYTAGPNIDITNHVVSGKDWTTEIQNASSYSYEQATAQIPDVPDVSNLPYIQNTALEFNGTLISGISGSGFYAASADYVLSGWEYDANNRISAYNGSAFAGQGSTGGIEYEGIAPIVVNNVEHKISAQSAKLGVQEPLYFVEDSTTATVIGISGDLTGQYIPYTNISTGYSGTTVYNVPSGIRITAASGWVEMYSQNKEYDNEAHLQVSQNYQNSSFWAEIDGTDGGLLHMNWNSGNISPNDHNGYDVNTTAKMNIGKGWITYSAKEGPYWTINSAKVNKWDSVTNIVSSNSANWGGKNYISATNSEGTYTVVGGNNIEIGLQLPSLRSWSRHGDYGVYTVYGTGNDSTSDSAAEYRPFGMLLWSGSESAKLDYPAIKMLQALSGIISQYSAHWVLN